MKLFQIVLVPLTSAWVLPLLFTSLIPRAIHDVQPLAPGFSRGINTVYQDGCTSQEPDVPSCDKNSSKIIQRDDLQTDAPSSTMWQGVNGIQWDSWHQDVVVKSWIGAMEMAQLAVDQLTELLPGSPTYQLFQEQTTLANSVCQVMKSDATRSTPAYLLCYRTFIAAQNLAYGQLFGADPQNLQMIVNNFQRIIDQTSNLDAVGADYIASAAGTGRGGDNIYLTHGPTIQDLKGVEQCSKDTQALTVEASQIPSLSGSVPASAYIIHFCDPFFRDLPRMEVQR